MSDEKLYEWANEENHSIGVGVDKSGPWIFVDNDHTYSDSEYVSVNLPTDPDEVVKLLRAIVKASGTGEDIAVGRVHRTALRAAGVSVVTLTGDGVKK